ncbi:hypothetical protein BN1708_016364, partial [Verticillium longisporum]
MLMAALSAVLLAAGVLTHYWDIWTHRTVRGISFLFVGIDALGDVFSLADADTASSHSSKASNSKKRKHHHHKSAVSSPEASDADTASQSSKRSKKSKRRHADADARAAANGGAKRRPSLSQPARDPRDITVRKMKKLQGEEEEDKPVVRTPSPVIDFDGLSRP